MDKAKATVDSFLGGRDKHNVTVEETTAPALTNETVHKSRDEVTQNVIDREVHKTHHHTTLQPVKDSQVMPETSEHKAHAVEERVLQHGDNSELERGLAAEREKFRDRHHVMPTQVTESVAPTAVGEHVHHHIVETVQPVIQRDTHQHHTVHHTKPVHEVHHHAPRHHEATALPAVSMDQFRAQGGSLTGKAATHDEFKGHHDIEGILGRSTGGGMIGSGSSGAMGTGSAGGAGPHSSRMENKLDPRVDSDGSKGYGAGATSGMSGSTGTGYGSNTTGTTGTTGTGYGSNTTGTTGTTGTGYGSSTSGTTGSSGTGYGSNTTGTTSGYGTSAGGAGPHSSSMENKLDPRVDSDGSKGYGAGANNTSSSNNNTSGTTGPHSSSLLNKLDPRVKN